MENCNYTVVLYWQKNILDLKDPKKDTTDFPRKSEVSFYREKYTSDFLENLRFFFKKKLPQISVGNLTYLTFQIKYSLAVKSHYATRRLISFLAASPMTLAKR